MSFVISSDSLNPTTPLQNLISAACNVILCLFDIRVSQSYRRSILRDTVLWNLVCASFPVLYLGDTRRTPTKMVKCLTLHLVPRPRVFQKRLLRGILRPSVKEVKREGAEKSLARPTSRCRRTESIVSSERGVLSCAALQVFSCYRGWKETCRATRAISTTSRR